MPDDNVDSDSLSESEPKSRADRLAERLLGDRAKAAAKPAPRVGGCFLCGRSYSLQPSTGDDSTRFCSAKCRDAYDVGAMPAIDLNPFNVEQWRVIAGPPPGPMPKAMRMGKHGFYIDCLHCTREFESKGLRCCSVECERGLKGRAEAVAVMAEVGDAPTEKRKCESCGGSIPNWIGEGVKRRRTPKSRRYCSDSCSAKARRMGASEAIRATNPPLGQSGPFDPSTPLFGPSTPPVNLVGGYRWPDAPDVGLPRGASRARNAPMAAPAVLALRPGGSGGGAGTGAAAIGTVHGDVARRGAGGGAA